MQMTKPVLGAAAAAAAAISTGALAALLPLRSVVVLTAAIGFGLAVSVVHFGAGERRAWHPVLMGLTGVAMISVTWNGLPPKSVSAPDLVLLAALGVLAYCWAEDSVRVPIPGWLAGAAALLFASELVAELFVPDPPLDPPPSFTVPGAPLITLARTELAFFFVPVLIGAVASSWRRAHLIADLWVASAVISAAIATFDAATGAGIGANITGVHVEARSAGLALHANTFALTCAMTLPIALLRAAQLHGWGRALAIGATIVLLAGILSSGSRVGFGSALLAIWLTPMLIPKLRTRILMAGVAAVMLFLAVAALAPAGNSLLSGFERLGGSGSAAGANIQRFDQVEDSLEIALDHPVTGVGFSVIADAHVLPLQYWEAGGVLGVLALILYATGALGTGWRLLRDRTLPQGIPEFAGAVTISFAVYLIAGLIQNQIADRYIYIPVGLLLGLAVAANSGRSERVSTEPGPASAPESPRTGAPEAVERVPL